MVVCSVLDNINRFTPNYSLTTSAGTEFYSDVTKNIVQLGDCKSPGRYLNLA